MRAAFSLLIKLSGHTRVPRPRYQLTLSLYKQGNNRSYAKMAKLDLEIPNLKLPDGSEIPMVRMDTV